MKTLILISVVHIPDRIMTRSYGLYMLEADGDFSWLDGLQLQNQVIGGESYLKIRNLLFRSGKPGEPYFVLKEEVKKVLRFPQGPYHQTVHCEVWL